MQCNIDSRGRRVRGISALVMVILSIVVWWMRWPLPIGIALLLTGLFCGFEALKGWCALRALGIKTKY